MIDNLSTAASLKFVYHQSNQPFLYGMLGLVYSIQVLFLIYHTFVVIRDKDRPDSLTILKRKDPNDDAERTGAETIKKIRLDEGSSKSPDQVIVSSPKHIPKNSPHLSPRGSAAASPGSSPGSTMSSDDPVIVGQISPRAKLIGMKLELEKKEQISSIDDKVTNRCKSWNN